jgi:ribosomal-protein-alanine N-acetyltransferase
MKQILTPILQEHAKDLFPLITENITQTIQWDGPSNFSEYNQGLLERENQHKQNKIYLFTIIHPELNLPIGSIDIRPDGEMFRANVGLWIGKKFSGQGLATQAVEEITSFGFNKLQLKKIEAYIFTGNDASKRVFEKCHYKQEGVIRYCTQKRGNPIDEWVMGKTHLD